MQMAQYGQFYDISDNASPTHAQNVRLLSYQHLCDDF